MQLGADSRQYFDDGVAERATSTTMSTRIGAMSATENDFMSKSQDSKKNVKKAPTRTPKEKKELKRLKKAGK
jgi:hypothetical protein